jgi:peptidoglycan/xylan/chitin deacetylase (PgdA/CDA1 family)
VQRRRPSRRLAALVPAAVAAGGLLAACTVPGASTVPASATPRETAVAAPSASAPTRPFRPTPTPAPTFAVYTVRRGDTLIALAARFETTLESLAYWNRARYPSLDPESPAYRPDRIEVGWQLAYLPGAVVDPEDLPPAGDEATDEPGPAASVGAFPTLPADGSAALVRRGPAGLGAVALTFEYGGGGSAGSGGPEAIVQWLEVNSVPATVFLASGASAPDDPVAVAVMARLRAGPALAPRVLLATTAPAAVAADLAAADAALAAALGRTAAPLWRPSRGTASPEVLRAAGGAGWTWAVTWDVDPGDGVDPGAGGPIATDILARVVSRAEGGSIIRLQLAGPRTLAALPGIMDGLADAGLRIAPLDEILGLTAGE